MGTVRSNVSLQFIIKIPWIADMMHRSVWCTAVQVMVTKESQRWTLVFTHCRCTVLRCLTSPRWLQPHLNVVVMHPSNCTSQLAALKLLLQPQVKSQILMLMMRLTQELMKLVPLLYATFSYGRWVVIEDVQPVNIDMLSSESNVKSYFSHLNEN